MRSPRREQDIFLLWLWTLRIRTLLVALLPCVLILPIYLYWLLSSGGGKGVTDSADTARRVLGLVDFDHLSGPEIKLRIDELLRI